jgi:hypothetical protein
MIFQRLAIAVICMTAWIPYSIIVLIQMFASTPELGQLMSSYFVYLPYFQALMLPYACIFFLPELKANISLIAVCRTHFIGGGRVHTINSTRKPVDINRHGASTEESVAQRQ